MVFLFVFFEKIWGFLGGGEPPRGANPPEIYGNFGHYYSFIKIRNNWYEFNDSIVRKIDKLDMNNNEICVLLYKKL